MTNFDLLARRNLLLGEGTPLFYEKPVHIVRGEGVMLYDAEGRQYVDMYNNVPCVGHTHPRVVQAMTDQAGTLNVHSRYLHEGILDYAERLLLLHDDSLTCAVFACSGTEANEVALCMAREATGGRGIICTDSAYHGNSAEVGKLTRQDRPDRADPEIRSIPFPQCYRPMGDGLSGLELTELYLAEVTAQIEDFAAKDIPFAGMLVCPLLANEGLPGIPEEFMARAANVVRAAGGLFITDEVQSGFCRTGSWWGYEVMGFVPDIVSMGKPMGNGLPLAGVVAGKELVDNYRKQTGYFNTFASSPLQAAVGMAVLEVIESEGLRENAADVGGYMRRELKQLQAECEPMGDVRGYGLFIGLEWVSDRETRTSDREGAVRIANQLKDKGFLISNAGALGNVLKIRPPLVFQRTHADSFLTAFAETVRGL